LHESDSTILIDFSLFHYHHIKVIKVYQHNNDID
jgi:hypothetical protein